MSAKVYTVQIQELIPHVSRNKYIYPWAYRELYNLDVSVVSEVWLGLCTVWQLKAFIVHSLYVGNMAASRTWLCSNVCMILRSFLVHWFDIVTNADFTWDNYKYVQRFRSFFLYHKAVFQIFKKKERQCNFSKFFNLFNHLSSLKHSPITLGCRVFSKLYLIFEEIVFRNYLNSWKCFRG